MDYKTTLFVGIEETTDLCLLENEIKTNSAIFCYTGFCIRSNF